MLFVYRLIVAVIFYCSLPLLLLLVFVTGKHREGLLQRFGFYPIRSESGGASQTVWLHASSVGEVQAVRVVIKELKKRLPHARYVLTTMTLHGRRVAIDQLDDDVSCFLAPLDIPFLVERAVRKIKPNIYICIETELWPLLLQTLSRKNVRICMINGRISERSFGKYLKIQRLLKDVLLLFDKMAVISERDKDKYISLGADPCKIKVEGNVKYDISLPADNSELIRYYRDLMALDGEEVFIAGSTHTGEEDMMLPLYKHFSHTRKIIFIIVPRHVERIGEIEHSFKSEKVAYQLFSDIKKGQKREESLLVVDVMGELAKLYSIGDYIFCGGSLVNKGGHNLMEAALWQKPVFYGPSISDFHDAAELLESAKAGYKVKNAADLQEKIDYFLSYPEIYRESCVRAGETARLQQGCSGRQVAYILD